MRRLAVGNSELEQPLGGLGCFLRGLHDAAQEEPDPTLPISGAANGPRKTTVI